MIGDFLTGLAYFGTISNLLYDPLLILFVFTHRNIRKRPKYHVFSIKTAEIIDLNM